MEENVVRDVEMPDAKDEETPGEKDVDMESEEEWGGGWKKAKVTIRKGLRRLVELRKTLPTTDEEEEESKETFLEKWETRWEEAGPGITPLRSWIRPKLQGGFGDAGA